MQSWNQLEDVFPNVGPFVFSGQGTKQRGDLCSIPGRRLRADAAAAAAGQTGAAGSPDGVMEMTGAGRIRAREEVFFSGGAGCAAGAG